MTFTRVDRLSDPFEGSYSKPNINARSESSSYNSNYGDNCENMSEVFKKLREYAFVNCWHINDDESAAMWKSYLKSDEGVAIQSRFYKLDDVLKNSNSKDLGIGNVIYINYDLDYMNDDNPIFAFFYKRKSFAYENELRAAFLCIPKKSGDYLDLPNTEESYEEDVLDLNIKLDYHVYYIPVNLNALIERIYVSPTAEDWFYELVQSVVRKYGLDVNSVLRSNLADDPIF